jgi:hypothetical protein
MEIARCTVHGIAYDSQREVCPGCATGAPAGAPEYSPPSDANSKMSVGEWRGGRQDVARATWCRGQPRRAVERLERGTGIMHEVGDGAPIRSGSRAHRLRRDDRLVGLEPAAEGRVLLS